MQNDTKPYNTSSNTEENQQHTSQTIIDLFATHKSWEDKYRQILQLSKSLTPMDEQYQNEHHRVKGCESDVWLNIMHDEGTGRYTFVAASNARIVRGLLVIIIAAYQDCTAAHIAQFDIKAYFAQLDLLKHLSPSRANGIYAIVEKISLLGK